MHQRRLYWRCRRGMKELDELLSRYVRERYAAAPPDLKAAFETLLELPDPQLADYLLGQGAPPAANLTGIVAAILART